MFFSVPNIDERLQKEIQKHRCNMNASPSDSTLSSTFSSQSFKVHNFFLIIKFFLLFIDFLFCIFTELCSKPNIN